MRLIDPNIHLEQRSHLASGFLLPFFFFSLQRGVGVGDGGSLTPPEPSTKFTLCHTVTGRTASPLVVLPPLLMHFLSAGKSDTLEPADLLGVSHTEPSQMMSEVRGNDQTGTAGTTGTLITAGSNRGLKKTLISEGSTGPTLNFLGTLWAPQEQLSTV